VRVITRGLPLLILASLLTATPVRAADQGDVGIVDGTVRVVAVATIPGESWGSDSECVYEVVIEDDLAFGVYEVDGTRMYSDTGRWLRKSCEGETIPVDGLFTFPEGDGFSTPDLLQQAIDVLDPPEPGWGASPDGVEVAMVTQLPTALWVDTAYWTGNFVARVETPSGRVWAEATAVPTSSKWTPGDGAVVTCVDGGQPWGPATTVDETACSHTYVRSTAGSPGYGMAVEVAFDVTGSTSTGGVQDLGQIFRSSAPVLVTVGEIQAIETSGT
jgi:hypothetical protein